MGLRPAQMPAWQVSVPGQASPSLQAVPLAAAGFVHFPFVGSHTPGVWHWSLGGHVTGVPAWQAPLALHVSLPLQELPSLQGVPAPTFVCVHVPPAAQPSVVHGLWSSHPAGVHVPPAFGNPSSNVYAALELPTSM